MQLVFHVKRFIVPEYCTVYKKSFNIPYSWYKSAKHSYREKDLQKNLSVEGQRDEMEEEENQNNLTRLSLKQ